MRSRAAACLHMSARTRGATFLPTQVIRDDGQSYGITMRALPCPTFRGLRAGWRCSRGAGMVVTRGTDRQIEASVEFLKWITEPENNISFFGRLRAICRSRHAACDMDAIEREWTAAERQYEDPLDRDRHGEQLRAVYHAGVHRRKGCAQHTGILHERPCIGADRRTVEGASRRDRALRTQKRNF